VSYIKDLLLRTEFLQSSLQNNKGFEPASAHISPSW